MPEILVKTQAEIDALPDAFEQYTVIKIEGTAKLIVSKRRGNSSVEARENSSVEAWGNSSVVAWGQVCVRVYSDAATVLLFAFTVAYAMVKAKIEQRSKTSVVIVPEEPSAEEYAAFALSYRKLHPEIPVVPLLDSTVCKIVNSGEGSLDMSDWHGCETTHCRAGWAIHLAGKQGYELEEKYGSHAAGEKIYLASTGRVPDFFATNKDALDDICKWGAIEEAAQQSA